MIKNLTYKILLIVFFCLSLGASHSVAQTNCNKLTILLQPHAPCPCLLADACGGTAPYIFTYLWNDGSTTSCPGALGSGPYVVTVYVMDAQGQRDSITRMPSCCALTCPNDTTICYDLPDSLVVLGTPTISAGSNGGTGPGGDCLVDSIWNNSTGVYPVGTTIITWTAIVNGQIKTCTQKVIRLNTGPVTSSWTTSPLPLGDGKIHICRGDPVYFSDSGAVGITNWEWDFGDGYASSLNNPTHFYNIAGTWTAIVKGYDACGNLYLDSIDVIVDPSAGPDIFCISVQCPGDTAVYHTNACGGASYQWTVSANGTILGSSTLDSVVVIWNAGPVGTISLLVTGCPGVCTNPSVRQVYIVPPTMPMYGDTVICQGTPSTDYEVQCIPGTNYNWTISPPSSYFSIDTFMHQITINWDTAYTGPVTITVNYQNVLTGGGCDLAAPCVSDPGCGGSVTRTVFVKPVFKINGPAKLCLGVPNTSNPFTSNTAATTWKLISPGGTSISGFPVSNTFNIYTWDTAGFYTVIATTPAGPFCNDSAFLFVEVLDLIPTPIVNGPDTVCDSTSYTYNITPNQSGVTYIWTVTNGTPNGITTTLAPSLAVQWFAGGGTISVRQQLTLSPFCESLDTMFNIVIYPPIVPPTIIGPASMCKKTIKTYYFNVGALQTDATYSWSVSPTSAGTIVSTNNKDSVTIKWIDEGNAFVKLKINLCGTDSSMLAVFVDSLPAVPNISYLPANPCMGDVVNFSTTSNGPGWQWNWNFGDPFATIPNPNTAITQNSSHIFTADGNYTVRLYVVNANGCADTSFATVHVDSVPQLPILAGDDSVCVGQTATYSFPQSLLTGALYTWSVTTQGFILSGQGTNSIVVQWNNAAPQNAQVMLNITSKCPITVPAFNVFINTPPTASFTSTSPQCAGSNMSFTGSGGGTYSWSFPGALPATSTIVNPVVVYSGAGTYTVTLTVTDANGCTATTTSPVVVNPPPGCIFATTTNDLNVCSFPTTVTVSASNAGGYTYMWTPANTNASFSTTITGPTSFSCIITNTNGCSAMTNTLNFVQDTLCLPPDTGDCVPSLACNMDFTWTPPICKTDSFIYTGTATLTGWDFGDANTGGAVSPITHTYATIGSYNVTVMGTCAGTTFPTGVGCIANVYKTHSVIIPVDPCFTINFRCVANVIFTDIADCSCMIGNASGYTWAWYLNGSLIPFSTAQNPPSQLLTGTNTIVMKMTNIATGAVCTTSQTFTVPTPIVAAFTAPTPVCIGTSVNFVDMSAGSVSRLWTFAGSANPSSSGAASASVLYTGVGGLANLSVTDAYGCTSSTSQLITVNPAGVGSITVGISSCDSVQLTASGTGPFSWSNVNPPNNVNPIYVKQNGFYSVTAIDPTFGCSYTATTTQIIVNASPVANITGPTKYCPGENLDLKTSAGGNSTTYSWVQTPTGSVVGTSANLTIPVPTAGTYTYTVTITANGCTSTASIVVTIDAVPISAVIDSSGSLTFCQGDSVNLFVNPAAIGGSYTWTKTPPPTITDTNPNFWVTVGGTYNVTVVTANGCPYPAISPVVVNVCDLPLTAISGDTVYCEGETLMLQTFPGFTYQWYYNGLPLSSTYGAVADMNFDIVIPNLLPTFSGMYCVVATNNCGCKDSVCVNVVVNPLPATPIITPFTGPYPGSIPASLPLCEGPLYTLKVTPTYSPSIKLTWNTGQVGSVVPAAFAKDYIVTATDTTTGCNVSSTITVNPLPDLSCAPSGCYDFCNECGAVTIPGPEGITTYQWEQKVGVTWVAYSNTQNITVTSPGGTFRLIGYNIFGCSDTSQNLVINFQDCCDTNACNINIDLVKKNVSCYGANDGTATAVASGGTPIYTYTWSGGTIVTATDGSVSNATGLSPGTYTVIVTDSVSCSDTATFTITEPPQIILNLTAYASACSDTCNGYIDIAVDSGFAPYDIIVYGPNPGDTAALILNINDTLYGNGMGSVSYVAGFFCNGIYTVVVTDSNGCTVIADVELVDTNQIVLTETHVNVACNGEATGSIDLTVTGGFPPVTYLWNNGETTQDIDTLYAGLYSVIVTDSNGCTSELIVEITENPPFFIGKTLQNNQCHGDSTGQISIFVSGAVPFTSGAPYTYLWSDGQTTSVANYLVAGTYTVTVTDSIGCDTILTFQIFEPTLLDQTHTITQPLCNGGTGDITVNGFGGTPWSGLGAHAAGYEYSLDGGTSQTNGTFTGITGGSHTIAITDSNSCITYLVFTINVPTPLVCGGAVTNVMCNGGNNGSITANITGGTGNYSYVWNDGSTNQTLNGLTSGVYTVTVTDGNGCTIECTYTVTEPLPITFTAAACANVSCFGGNDGKACVTNVLGGTAPYTYQWNTLPAQTTAQATGLTAGTWTVTVMDAMGCIATGDVIITQPSAALSITGTVTNTTCNGGNNGAINITVTGGTAPTTLLWSNGNTTTSNTGLVAGTYTVTVTDANNCITTGSYVVAQPAAIAITLVSGNVSCNGGANGSITANVSGGTGTYSYAWSNGASTSGVSGLAAGIYTVTVTDANGCTMSASATITSPAALGCICNSNVTNVSCFGGSNGSVTAQPLGGTAPYSYVWNTGATTQTISSLAAGTYTVTITDANGCTKVGTATITQPNVLVLTVTGSNLTCNGNGGGSATASISGGVAPYTYLWTPTGQTTATATGLAAGSYTVQVTDANGCTVTGQVTLTQPAQMNLTSKKTNVSCYGGNNGTLTVVVAGGSAPFTYLWSNGKTTKYIIGLAAGTYTVTVTDANGCTKTLSNSVGQPAALLALYTVTNVSCNGGSNGGVTLTVTGGTTPYKYLWSNGTTTKNLSGVIAGIYSVTVQDKKGCIINATAVISQPAAIIISMTPKSPKCNGAATGQATATVTGGTSPYTYLWSNSATTATATGLAAGTYTVTVTDNKGCTKTGSVTLTQPAALSCTATVMQGILCNGGTGKAGVTVTGGTPGYTYTWNTVPVTTTAIANNLAAGTYTVIVKDKNNCTTSCTVTLNQPAIITCAPLTSTPVLCNGATTGTATLDELSIVGGTGPYTYLWNTGVAQTTAIATGLGAGTYTVTITDANGCTKTASVVVTQPTALTATYNAVSPGCSGGLGSITVTGAGGTPAYSYTLNPGAVASPTGIFTGLATGLYSITVTDANLCETIITGINITAGSAITANALTSTNVSCTGGNNGTATISGITGGTAPYTILWSSIPAQGTNTATGLTAGTYNVTVTDANGCIYTSSTTITEPVDGVVATITGQTNIACNGGTVGDATVTGSGGTPYTSGDPYTYLWSDGQTTATAVGLTAGTYVVTVTDSLGCNATTQVIITQPGSLSISGAGTDVLCNGGTTGIVMVQATSGTAPYTFAITPAGTQSNPTADSAVFTGLAAGTYTVTVTDAGGCTAETDVMVMEPSALATAMSSTALTCNGNGSGTATVNVIGGTLANDTIATQGLITISIDNTGFFGDETTYELVDASNNVVQAGGPFGFGAFTVSAPVLANNGPYTFNISNFGFFNDNFSNWAVMCNGNTIASGCLEGTAWGGSLCSNSGFATASNLSCASTTTVNNYTYQWSNGQSTQTATGLSAGTHTVTVTDGNGCISTNSIDVTEPSALVLTPSQTNVLCNGQSTGSATATVTGGTLQYSYHWSNGQNTATITGLTAGTYNVTVSDANGCIATNSYVITENTGIAAMPSQTPILCNGGTSTLTVNPAGGVAPYTYSWSQAPGNTTNTAIAPAGVYYVTITDSAGCSIIYCFVVNEPSALTCAGNSTSAACIGGTGTAAVGVSGGVSSIITGTNIYYLRSQAAGEPWGVTNNIEELDGAFGAGNWTPETFETATAATIFSTTTKYVFMDGSDAGADEMNAFLTANLPLMETWVNGGGKLFLNSAPNEGGNINFGFGGTTLLYPGATFSGFANVNGGQLGHPIFNGPNVCGTSWSGTSFGHAIVGGTLTSLIDGDAPGVVMGEAVWGAGKVIFGGMTQSFFHSPSPEAGFLRQNIHHYLGTGGGSVTCGGYTYLWSNGATTATMSDIAGTYTVIVTDCNGCTTVCTVVIAEPTQLTVGTSNTNVTCQNPTGTAVAIVGGGTAPYTYAWSNGATTSAVTGLTPGTYTVTVNDANNCGPVTAQAIILAPIPVTCSTTATMSTCNGYHNGTATVTAGGGNGLYSIIWNTAPTQTTTTATGLAAGTYTVIVMDGLGCLSTCSVTVTEPAPMVYTYNVNNTCSGSNGGVATINTMGGTMYTVGDPYTYLWSNGQTTQTATGLGAGTVYVTITDSMGCSIQATVIVPAGSTLSCNTICTPTYCGQALGTATANVFGGTAPYIYQWSNGNNNSVNTGLIAGVYTVLITDANGCTTMCTAMVGEPAAISYSLTTVNALCNGGTGSLAITNLNGGTAPYTYLWSDNSTLNSITGLAGTYTVTVTDTNGCSASQSATIVEPLALATTMSGSNVTCNGYSNGTAAVVATGGTAPYSYVWNTGGSLNNIWNLIAGTYTVTVTDANGCIATNNIVVAQPAVLDTISTSSTAATCGACNGTGTATITGGTLPYTYLWGNGNTNAIATGLCGGNNFVVVTDANGCTITVCVKVNSTGGFTASLNSPTYAGGYNIRCNGGLDGAINLTTNPQGAYTYSWSNGATTEDLFGVGAGTYDVIVSYGTCTQAVSITLTEPTLLTATATGTNVGCNGNNNGTATASGAGGVMPYTYAWSNGQTTQTATGLMGGTYTVTIGDANGCTATASYAVTAPASGLSITESHVNPTCTGNNGSINITVTGGTPPYTYIWTGGQTTQNLSGIGAGSHTVTVTDAGGCTISLCVVLTQPNAMVVSVSTSAASCNGGNNGSAAAAASGGTAPYSYLWSNGGNTSSITGLYPGTYTVTVTDAAGCTTSMSKVVGAPTAIVIVTDSTTNVTGMGGTNGAAYISVSGGTSPYTYTWNTIPVKTTQDVTGLGAGTYTVTVMDASGCISQKSIVITSGVFTCNTFHTETAVSWKTAPAGTNIGAYLNVHFAAAFPSSLVVGGGCIGSKTLTLNSANAVRNFLNNQPLTGGATKLTINLLNATGLTFPSAFGANLVALKMNVVFDAYDANFAPTSTVTLGSMIYQGGGTVNGLTVTQILNEANKLFGGCTSIYDSLEVRNAVKLINESWLGSPGVPFNNVLTCPAPPKATNNALVDITSIVAYPNPTEGQLNIKFVTEQDGNVNVRIIDALGRLVFNKSHAAVEGQNDFALDISNLNTGVYMVNVQVNGMQQTIRVVVK